MSATTVLHLVPDTSPNLHQLKTAAVLHFVRAGLSVISDRFRPSGSLDANRQDAMRTLSMKREAWNEENIRLLRRIARHSGFGERFKAPDVSASNCSQSSRSGYTSNVRRE